MNQSANLRLYLIERLSTAAMGKQAFLAAVVLFLILAASACGTPPDYSRFVEIDENGWTRMAAVEFIPSEEDSNFIAPRGNVSVLLTLRHDRKAPSPIRLEITRTDSDMTEHIDTIIVPLRSGAPAKQERKGSFGLALTTVYIEKATNITSDFRLAISPVDTVRGLHSIGLSVIAPQQVGSLLKTPHK